jgi:hypothetical protein
MSDAVAGDKPAFEIINPKTGHRIAIYADGRVEGFEDGVYIVNRIPLLLSDARGKFE